MKKYTNFFVKETATLKKALKVITDNKRDICFILKKGKVVGIATEGDIRRALLRGIDINSKISNIMNKKFVYANVKSSEGQIKKLFNNKINIIPLLDKKGNFVDFADKFSLHQIPITQVVLGSQELTNVKECIKTNWISSQGRFVNEFENSFSKLFNNQSAVSTCNGTAALTLALKALGIKSGDEVIVPDLTFAATINSIIHVNAKPVICDVNKNNWGIDINSLNSLISKKTKAVMVVHLYGLPADIHEISKLCKKKKLKLIEDCAESIGSKYNNKYVGTFGDASTFSFFGNKTITTGEGGMVLFKSKSIAQKAKIYRDHGMTPGKRYWHEVAGYNYRMTNLQAAIGLAQLEKIDKIIDKKIKIALRYNHILKSLDEIEYLPKNSSKITNTFWLYTFLLKSEYHKKKLETKLIERGIDVRPIFFPLHKMPPYKKFLKSKVSNSIWISKRGLSLPSSPKITKIEIDYICSELKKVIKEI